LDQGFGGSLGIASTTAKPKEPLWNLKEGYSSGERPRLTSPASTRLGMKSGKVKVGVVEGCFDAFHYPKPRSF
jgi:hypothetical protein